MKHKTSELNGALLDAAVAKANGLKFEIRPEKIWGDGFNITIVNHTPVCRAGRGDYEPSTDWAQGGPIIERERISLIIDDGYTEAYVRLMTNYGELAGSDGRAEGPTPLIAAMRAYVASKLGDEVEL